MSMAPICIIHLQKLGVILPRHEDIPDPSKIGAQIIINHRVFADTVPLKPTDTKDLWELAVDCTIPRHTSSFTLAILRIGPSDNRRLLGTLNIPRTEVLTKEGDGQPIECSHPIVKVNEDGPAIVIRTTFSLLFEQDIPNSYPEHLEIPARQIQRYTVNPQYDVVVPHLRSLYASFTRREQADMCEVSTLYEALLLFPPLHPGFKANAYLLKMLGDICSKNHNATELDCLHRAVDIYNDAVRLAKSDGSPDLTHLNDLGISLKNRFRRTSNADDINQSIQMLEDGYQKMGISDSEKQQLLGSLGNSLLARFEWVGDVIDLNRSVQVHETAIKLIPDGDPSRVARFNELGISLLRRYEHLGDIVDLNRSIQVYEDAIKLAPDDHPDKAFLLSNLGTSLVRRYEQLGNIVDLSRSIQVHETAIRLRPEDQSNKGYKLGNLGIALVRRFERLGDIADLNRSIQCYDDALRFTPHNHLDESFLLNNLGISLFRRYEQLGDLADLNRSIQASENAVNLVPDRHSSKAHWLDGLGNSLIRRFERLGDIADPNRSIRLRENSISLTPNGLYNQARRMNNIANAFLTRFRLLGDLDDLSRSVQLNEDALQATPDDHPEKSSRFDNLGASLLARFTRLGDPLDLSMAVQAHENAIQLTPDGDPDRATRYNHLGFSLLARFEQTGDINDLNRLIQVDEDIVQSTPDTQPSKLAWSHNLAASLATRYERLGDSSDLHRSIEIYRNAIRHSPDDHPTRARLLCSLGVSFARRFEKSHDQQDLLEAISCYSSAAQLESGAVSVRFLAGKGWMNSARLYDVKQAMDACTVTMDLIPELTWLGSSLTDRHHRIKEVGVTARIAMLIAIAARQYHKAVEWAEQGRSVVWNQLLQLRSPMDDLQHASPDLAARLQMISSQLEDSTAYSVPGNRQNGGSVQMDYHSLAHERNQVLEEIRQLEGFEHFFLHKTISQLLPAAEDGPVVLLNLSEDGIDALIVCQDDNVLHVPLPIGIHTSSEQRDNCAEGSNRGVSGLLERLKAVDVRLSDVDACKSLLEDVWDLIVCPIVECLRTTEPEPDTLVSGLRRIWWCPTGPLARLPIHAAGVYPTGPKLSDFFISSYTPSMAALLDKNRNRVRSSRPCQLVTVSLPVEARLPGTAREVRCIASHAKNVRVIDLRETEATPKSVAEALKQSDWVHFACHGKQVRDDPTRSHLLLSGGSELRLSDIIRLRLERARLAVLSACQTAAGDKKLEDEAVHLAAGMLFAGYCGVIATMQTVDDEYAADVMDEMYRCLFVEYGGDSGRAAEALHFAVRKVREGREAREDTSFSWVPFIHMGL